MVIFVVFTQFMGVMLVFMVLPIFLIPFLEERFETKLPNEATTARNHVVIFDYGPTVIIDEDETEARHLLAHYIRSFSETSTKVCWRNPI